MQMLYVRLDEITVALMVGDLCAIIIKMKSYKSYKF